MNLEPSIFRPDPGHEDNAIDVCITEHGVTLIAIAGGEPRLALAMSPCLARIIADQLIRVADAAEAHAEKGGQAS